MSTYDVAMRADFLQLHVPLPDPMNLIKMLSALSLSISAFCAQAGNLEVAGVKLGMPAAATKDIVAASNPKYKISMIKNASGVIIGVNGLLEGRHQPVDEHFQVLNDEEGKVWFVGKAQTVPRGSSFTAVQMQASLIEKYGTPSMSSISAAGGSASWHFDRAGNLFKGTADRSPCLSSPADAQIGYSVIGAFVRYPTTFSPTCGHALEARFSGNERTGLVEIYKVIAYEAASTLDATIKKNEASKRERETKINNEINSGNKPRL